VTLVIDASLALTWCFEDERSEDTIRIGRRVIVEGATVPGLFDLEIANAMLIAERKGRITSASADEWLNTIRLMPIAVDAWTLDVAWTDTLRIARGENLTVYDATYLELALRLQAELATLDAKLIAAAERRGIAVLP
jgi:predicted nucleic acid-binding protein